MWLLSIGKNELFLLHLPNKAMFRLNSTTFIIQLVNTMLKRLVWHVCVSRTLYRKGKT